MKARDLNHSDKLPPQAFRTTDPVAAFEHFRPLLERRRPASVITLRGDPAVMRINITRGVDALQSYERVVLQKAPLTSLSEIYELPALGLALLYAADRVSKADESSAKLLLDEARPLREQVLRQLEIFASLGILSPQMVAEIRSGTGWLDTARDCIAIAGVFREHAATLAGKHPFSDQQLARLGELGSELLHRIHPAAATPEAPRKTPEAELRDLFHTEVQRRHVLLREAGVAAVGLKRLDEHFPPLRSRLATATAPALAVTS